ncbi:MAG: hypothetical protein R3C59_09605 [Planctomycetaceae bacterium]
MQSDSISNFLKRYPGPYVIIPGSDGVDFTFDLCCRSTKQPIVSVAYWSRQMWARRVARVIRLALLRIRGPLRGGRLSERDRQVLAAFFTEMPGPFRHEFLPASIDGTPNTLDEWLVTCESSGCHPVGFFTYRSDSNAELVTATVAEAINRLRADVIAFGIV